MDFRAIKAEITNNAAIYQGMTDAQIATALMAKTVVGSVQPLLVPTTIIYNTIVPADFQSLTAANQQLVRDILSMGSVNASPGTNVRAVLQSVFTGKTNTLTALAALAASYDTPTLPFARLASETITAAVVTAAKNIAWTATVSTAVNDPNSGNIAATITYSNGITTQTQTVPGSNLTDAQLQSIAQNMINILVGRDVALSQLTIGGPIT